MNIGCWIIESCIFRFFISISSHPSNKKLINIDFLIIRVSMNIFLILAAFIIPSRAGYDKSKNTW